MPKAPMGLEEIARRRDEIVAARGPWRSSNVRLAAGVYTISDDAEGDEARVRHVVQLVVDLASGRGKSLRVLDLGCGEGGVALELGKQGAEVVGIEGRAALAEKAEFAREALGLRRVTIVHGDVRRATVEDYGFFDVVLALGVLDRLDAPAIFEVTKRVGAACTGLALVEAELAPRGRVTRRFEGVGFPGASRREHASGASRAERLAAADRSLDNEFSFLLTRAAMLALLERSGFTSIAEAMDPDRRESAPRFAAFKGRRVALQTMPQANAAAGAGWGDALRPAAKGRIRRLLARGKR